jgi:hypothetical protein
MWLLDSSCYVDMDRQAGDSRYTLALIYTYADALTEGCTLVLCHATVFSGYCNLPEI